MGSLVTDPGGETHFDVVGASNAAPSVTTEGEQEYGDAVILVQDTVLQGPAVPGQGDVRFVSTVDSHPSGDPKALTVNTAGDTIFEDAVGGQPPHLQRLETDPAGDTIFLEGADVITVEDQIFNDHVTLEEDTSLTGTSVIFVKTLSGAHALDVSA